MTGPRRGARLTTDFYDGDISNARWMAQAACVGKPTEWWFPSTLPTDYPYELLAKEICAECPVCAECLQLALADRHTVGIWGGTNERERRAMRRPSHGRKGQQS